MSLCVGGKSGVPNDPSEMTRERIAASSSALRVFLRASSKLLFRHGGAACIAASICATVGGQRLVECLRSVVSSDRYQHRPHLSARTSLLFTRFSSLQPHQGPPKIPDILSARSRIVKCSSAPSTSRLSTSEKTMTILFFCLSGMASL